MTTRSLQSLLGADDVLRPLVKRVNQLLELQRIFTEAVPRTLSDRCRVASLEGDRLVILTDGPAIAAKLRQLTPSLLQHFARSNTQYDTQYDTKVNGIRVLVQVDGKFSHVIKAERPRNLPGNGALRSLEALAGELPPSPLRDAVARFGARLRQEKEG